MYSDEWTLGNFSFMGLWKHRALQLPYYRRRKLIKQYQKSPSLLTSPSVFCGSHYFFCISIFPFFFFQTRGGGGKGAGRETWICCFTYLCIHWLILVCSLTEYGILLYLGVSVLFSDQVNYLTRASFIFFCVFL